MIERYTSQEMGDIWCEPHKLVCWAVYELAVMEAQAELGIIPLDALETCRTAPLPTPDEVRRREAELHHDVMAFLSAWSDNMPEAQASWLHYGLTSSDMVDSGLAIQLDEASNAILRLLDWLVVQLRDHAIRHAGTVRIGRTHGMFAEVTTWGMRMADFAFAADRLRTRFKGAIDGIRLIQVSGPVGTYSTIDPRVEIMVADTLGMRPARISSQVIMRDGIAHWAAVLVEIVGLCEAIALEVRHGQRSEVAEMAEGFGSAQRGSSSMPHKRNPIAAENICGLTRVARGLLPPILENVALWHERDISHSSVERTALPDLAILTDHLLRQTVGLVSNLVVDEVHMLHHVRHAGELVLTSQALLIMVRHGVPRERVAYPLIQQAAGQLRFDQQLAPQIWQAALSIGLGLPTEMWDELFALKFEMDVEHIIEVVGRVHELH
jgi:adenylosuccinate lyase